MMAYLIPTVTIFKKQSGLALRTLIALSLFPARFTLQSADAALGRSSLDPINSLVTSFLLESSDLGVPLKPTSSLRVPHTVRHAIK